MRKVYTAISIAALALSGSTACATKKFVRTATGELNDKVESLGRSLEDTQERTRQNERRIVEVDQKVQAADQMAQSASSLAASAASTANTAGLKLDALDRASRRLVLDVVLSEDEGNFQFGGATLPAEAKTRISLLISQLKQDPKNVYIEIEGHTDDVGDYAVNQQIGLARAVAVQRYLYEQYQIPLHKMSVISFGEEKPVATNATKSGRAQNRRVVIRVIA